MPWGRNCESHEGWPAGGEVAQVEHDKLPVSQGYLPESRHNGHREWISAQLQCCFRLIINIKVLCLLPGN